MEITEKEYKRLLEREQMLLALEASGVRNSKYWRFATKLIKNGKLKTLTLDK